MASSPSTHSWRRPRDVTPALVKKMRWGCKHMAEAVEGEGGWWVVDAASEQRAPGLPGRCPHTWQYPAPLLLPAATTPCPAADSQHMFVPLEPLLEAASAQQACQRLQEAAAGGFGSNSSGSSPPAAVRGYDRPLDGSCPLTGEQGWVGRPALGQQPAGRPACAAAAADPLQPTRMPSCQPSAARFPLLTAARKFPAYTALRVRQLFATSCPGGAPALAESKAAQLFRVERDPSVVLLRGRACAPDVQRAVMLRSAAGGATRRAARRLLCAASAWLALDPLEAACADV